LNSKCFPRKYQTLAKSHHSQALVEIQSGPVGWIEARSTPQALLMQFQASRVLEIILLSSHMMIIQLSECICITTNASQHPRTNQATQLPGIVNSMGLPGSVVNPKARLASKDPSKPTNVSLTYSHQHPQSQSSEWCTCWRR
jgi:hypothetical protein